MTRLLHIRAGFDHACCKHYMLRLKKEYEHVPWTAHFKGRRVRARHSDNLGSITTASWAEVLQIQIGNHRDAGSQARREDQPAAMPQDEGSYRFPDLISRIDGSLVVFTSLILFHCICEPSLGTPSLCLTLH